VLIVRNPETNSDAVILECVKAIAGHNYSSWEQLVFEERMTSIFVLRCSNRTTSKALR
jgi:hypothetical protein